MTSCKEPCCKQSKASSCCDYNDGLGLPAEIVGTWNLATTRCNDDQSTTTYQVLSLHADCTATMADLASVSTKLGEWKYVSDNCIDLFVVGVETDHRSLLQTRLHINDKDKTLRAITVQLSKYELDDLTLENPISVESECDCKQDNDRLCIAGAKVIDLIKVKFCKKKKHHHH